MSKVTALVLEVIDEDDNLGVFTNLFNFSNEISVLYLNEVCLAYPCSNRPPARHHPHSAFYL
jgi:hypothetical protein